MKTFSPYQVPSIRDFKMNVRDFSTGDIIHYNTASDFWQPCNPGVVFPDPHIKHPLYRYQRTIKAQCNQTHCGNIRENEMISNQLKLKIDSMRKSSRYCKKVHELLVMTQLGTAEEFIDFAEHPEFQDSNFYNAHYVYCRWSGTDLKAGNLIWWRKHESHENFSGVPEIHVITKIEQHPKYSSKLLGELFTVHTAQLNDPTITSSFDAEMHENYAETFHHKYLPIDEKYYPEFSGQIRQILSTFDNIFSE